jgi:hypothetical protein
VLYLPSSVKEGRRYGTRPAFRRTFAPRMALARHAPVLAVAMSWIDSHASWLSRLCDLHGRGKSA